MRLPPPVRKAGLTVHVLCSVGWAGAVVIYLALGVAAISTDNTQMIRAAYLAMDWAAWVVLVPLAAASLITGVAQALATPWGLLRHYWVIIKLTITLIATVVLVAYTQTLTTFAEVASRVPLTAADLAFLRTPSVVLHASAALLLLLGTTTLAVYKPTGLTRHGQRERQRARTSA